MSRHLSKNEIELFNRNLIGPDILLSVSDHIEACPECRRELREITFPKLDPMLIESMILEKLVSNEEHFEYTELAAFVDRTLDGAAQTRLSQHLDVCEKCSEDVDDLRLFAHPNAGRPRSLSEKIWLAPARYIHWRALRVAFPLVLLVAILSLLWFDLPTSDESGTTIAEQHDSQGTANFDQSIQPSEVFPTPKPERTHATEDFVTDQLFNSDKRRAGDSAKSRESLGDHSRIPSSKMRARAILLEDMAIGNVEDLKTPLGVLMGPEQATHETFQLLHPVGKVIIANKPELRWSPLEGVEEYEVEIYDMDFNKVASSGPIEATAWTPSLRQGTTYQWTVTARKDGRKVTASQNSALGAKFRILDSRRARRIAALRKKHPNNGLTLGIAYAEAGMLEEAIDELERLMRAKPELPGLEEALKKLKQSR